MATKHIQHLRSKALIDDTTITRDDGTIIGDPLPPNSTQINEGEIAINYNAGNEQLFIKNSNGDIVSLLNKDAITCVTAKGDSNKLTLTSTLDDDGCVAISGSVDLTDYATTTELATKQDILTAGTGIDITNNIISTTIDNNPFIFCEELPTTDIKEGKIYCIPNEESTEENNIWDEYYYANGQWELMGKYIPTVDLTPYAKKDEIPTKTSDLENDSGYITESAIETKQDKLTAGTGIDIATDNTISTTLIYDSTDNDYVIKAVDNEGNILVAVKTSGEIYVPIGTTEDSYDLIYALYEKLASIIPSLIGYGDATYDSTNERKKLIDSTVDTNYVIKMEDAEGQVLQGIKENGEINIPIGISDDAYDLFTAIYNKLAQISDYLRES